VLASCVEGARGFLNLQIETILWYLSSLEKLKQRVEAHIKNKLDIMEMTLSLDKNEIEEFHRWYNNGNWDLGDFIEIVRINGTDFIRTDRNHTPADNLGSLPEF